MAFTFFDLKYMHSGWRIVGFVNNHLNSSLKFDVFWLKRKYIWQSKKNFKLILFWTLYCFQKYHMAVFFLFASWLYTSGENSRNQVCS